MNDLIKREDAIDELMHIIPYKRYRNGEYVLLLDKRKCLKAIKDVPAADRPQAEWIPCTKEGLPLTELGRRERQKWYGYKCSKCNFVYKGNALTESPFCQNCGAHMKGANNEA